jgi:LysR family transcriptional activator of dmlA
VGPHATKIGRGTSFVLECEQSIDVVHGLSRFMDKLRALRFFCRVAETSSFAAAAYELDVVPSVLSKVIASLETDVQFKLFNRTTRRVSLTEGGTRYYDQCKQLLIELEEAELLARDGTTKPTGRIVVGMHPAFNRLLMSRINEFLASYPHIVVETTITSTPGTLFDDKLDLLITFAELPDSNVGVRMIGTTRHILLASPAYLQKHGVPQTPEDLRKHTFIVSGRPDGPSYTRWTMRRGSEVQTVHVPVRMISRQGAYMHEAVLCGAGICRLVELFSPTFSSSLIEGGQLVQVLPDWSLGSLSIRVVVPDRKNVPAKVRVFIEFLHLIIREANKPATRANMGKSRPVRSDQRKSIR